MIGGSAGAWRRKNPRRNAAAVCWQRGSLEEYTFMSCRTDPTSMSSHKFWRNAAPKLSAVRTPRSVSSPPHLIATFTEAPSWPNLAWHESPSVPNRSKFASASAKVPSGRPWAWKSMAAACKRAIWSAERRSNASGGAAVAHLATTSAPANQPLNQPAAYSDGIWILALAFCFGVRSPCLQTSKRQSTSSSTSRASTRLSADLPREEALLATAARPRAAAVADSASG
mmetsp:Transcript_113153/g.325338  ORF Transcript_113153/g.325338 Transcript_113153/m.325338 type:complete len:227 (+) Transcript_113153:1135-1815(+)